QAAPLVLVLQVERRGLGLTRAVEAVVHLGAAVFGEAVAVDVLLPRRETSREVVLVEAQLVLVDLEARLDLVIRVPLAGPVALECDVARAAVEVVVPQRAGAARDQRRGRRQRVRERIARRAAEAREEPRNVRTEVDVRHRAVARQVVEEQSITALA